MAPVGSGDRAKRCLSEGAAPRTFQPCRRCVETSGDVIRNNFTSTPDSRILDFSPMGSGNREDGKGIGEIAG